MSRSIAAGVISLGLILQAAAQDQAERVQAEAVRALAAEQRALREAIDAARKADQEAKEAPTDEARQAAAAKAQAAVRKLAEAQKGAAQRAAQLQAAAAAEAARAAANRAGAGRGGLERETVDPQDPVERFALLTSGGPLIVQATLTIDGQPFRIGREKLIAAMIAGADKDKDGKTTWIEAFASPRFTLGRLGNLNDQTRDSLIRSFDKNSNSEVEPAEARQFLAQFVQGATFSLGSGSGSFRVVVAGGALMPATGNQADLLTLLDTDQNKSLDAKEIAVATTRLKSRDADDNDVLDSAEISGMPAAGPYRVTVAAGGAAPPPGALLLGPTANADAVLAQLKQKYKNADGRLADGCFPQFPQLLAALDKDQSGAIGAGEVLGLNEVQPHVDLTVDLGTQKAGSGLNLTSVAAEVKYALDGTEKKLLEMPGVRISLAASAATQPMQNFEPIGKALLMRYDKDANGYLDASEVPAQQFALYDENGDGKAYPDEIITGYARQNAPQATQVVANITQQGNSLFQTLDANGDGRLGLREMRAAAERLAVLDKDRDQSIAGNEIPEAISVSFALGSSPGAVLERPVAGSAGPAYRAAAGGGPEWFTRMDRNADGDVTLKEFLGEEADFRRLDTNSDGFLEAAEAKAAGK